MATYPSILLFLFPVNDGYKVLQGQHAKNYDDLVKAAFWMWGMEKRSYTVHFHTKDGTCDGQVDRQQWDAGRYFFDVGYLIDNKLLLSAHFERLGSSHLAPAVPETGLSLPPAALPPPPLPTTVNPRPALPSPAPLDPALTPQRFLQSWAEFRLNNVEGPYRPADWDVWTGSKRACFTHSQLIMDGFGTQSPIPCDNCVAAGRPCIVFHPIIASWTGTGIPRQMRQEQRCAACLGEPNGPRCNLGASGEASREWAEWMGIGVLLCGRSGIDDWWP